MVANRCSDLSGDQLDGPVMGAMRDERYKSDVPMVHKFRYIGETSHALRKTASEHVDNVDHLKKESFWVEHWIETHGTNQIKPEFKFEVIVSYRDPMRRQLAEALMINQEGDLNRRNELNSNNMCKLVPQLFGVDSEKGTGYK